MAWSVVRSAQKKQTVGATTTIVTLGAAPATGNKIIVSIVLSTINTTPGISTVKDSNGNSLTRVAGPALQTNAAIAYIYAYDVPATPSTAFTITWAATETDSTVVAQEVSGLLAGNTTAMVDGTAGAGNGTVSSGTVSGPAYSTTAANEYLIELFGDFGNSATISTPTGYSVDTNSFNSDPVADCIVASKNSTSAAETVTWASTNTWGGSADSYVTLAVAFKLAASSTDASSNPPAAAQRFRTQAPASTVVMPTHPEVDIVVAL